MTTRLTEQVVERLVRESVGKPEAWHGDAGLRGFGLRTRPSGQASYAVKVRVGSRVLVRTLGSPALLPLFKARKQAIGILREIHHGNDPLDAPEAPQTTFGEVASLYLKDRALKPSARRTMEGVLRAHFSEWKDRPVASITKPEIEERIRAIQATAAARSRQRVSEGNQPGQGAAAKAARYMRMVFRFAVTSDVISADPTTVIRAKRLVRGLRRKQSYLPASKRASLRGLDGDPNAVDLAVVLLFTGLRLNEALGLRWEAVNLEDRLLTIPTTKSNVSLTLPFSKPVEEVLLRRKADSGRVFDQNYTKVYDQFKLLSETIGQTFTPHDCRRTFSTVATEVGVHLEILKRLLNHSQSGDVTSGYILVSPETLRRHVDAIAAGMW